MKKFTAWFVMCAVLLLAGCNRKSPEPTPQEAVLSVKAEGLKVLLGDSDTQRTFTVEAAEETVKDVVIKVATDAAAGRVSLESETVTIPKGSKTVSGTIKFNTAAFADGANEKITLTISSDGNTVESGSVVFEVTKSDVPLVLPVATLHCDVTEVLVAGEQVKVPVTIKLDKAAEQYTEFYLVFDTDNTISDGSWAETLAPYIDEGQTEVTFNMIYEATFFKPGVTGVSHLKLKSEYATIGDPSSVRFTVTGVEPNKATLSTDGLEVVVGDEDFEKAVTVTLSEPASTETVFAVAVECEEGGFEIVDKTITIAKGEKTGTGVIKFLKKAYPIELMTGTAIVSVISETSGVVVADPGNIVLDIKGTGTAPMAALEFSESLVKVPGADQEVSIPIELSESIGKDAVFTVTVESDKEGSYTVNTPTVTISKGETKAFVSVIFKASLFPYDTDKANVKVKISSEDVIVLNSASSVSFRVIGATVNPNKEDMKYKVQSSYDVYVGSTGVVRQMIYVNPEVYGTKNTKDNTIDAVITGGREGIDYEWDGDMPVTISAGQGYTYLYVNVLPAAAGKTLKLEIMSDDATIGAANTCDINVTYIEWPPVDRSAPKVKKSTAYDNYGLIFKGLTVNVSQKYDFTFSRPDWKDYYNDVSFEVKEGEAYIKMTVVVPSDDYYTSRAHLAVYADFNNDGNFSGAGEKVYLSKVSGIVVGTEKEVTITMNVPADAAAEFPVRIGTIISNDIDSDFADGYFKLPGVENLIQMADFKFVKF